MNQTLLKDLILAGHMVACKDRDWYRKVFLHIDKEWFFMWTICDKDINTSISDKLSSTIHTEDHIKEDFTWEYKIVTPLPQLPQVWDTVEVLEICRELNWFEEWDDERKDMVWKKHIVKGISNYWHIIIGDFWFLPWQVAKCEHEKEQPIESEGKPLEIIEFNWKRYIEMK